MRVVAAATPSAAKPSAVKMAVRRPATSAAAGGNQNPIAAAGHGHLLVVEVHKSTASSFQAGVGSGCGDVGTGQPEGGDRHGQERIGAEDQGAGCRRQ
jgi:hypothetical protein